KGDVVCQDPEWSLSLKRCFCGVLFTASLALFLLANAPFTMAHVYAKGRPTQQQPIQTPARNGDWEKAMPLAIVSPPSSTVAKNDSQAQPRVNGHEPLSRSLRLQAASEETTLEGKVFGRFGSANKPLESALIRAGQIEAYTDNIGGYRLRFPKTPRNDLLIMISHADCLPRFRRFDELLADDETVLEPKLRIAVFDFSFPNNDGFETLQNALRKSLEKELVNTGHIKVVLHDDEREKVLRVLRKQYEERGIYHKDTLIQMGRMCAASHGIYGSIVSEGPNYRVSCTLANLASGTTEKEQVVFVKAQTGWN